MRIPKAVAAVAGAVLLAISGCSAGGESTGGASTESPAIAEPETASTEPTSTSPTTPQQTSASTTATTAASTASTVTSTAPTSTAVPEPQVASATAESYKIVAPTVEQLGPGVSSFVATIEATRIDQLATTACADASSELNESELGLQGLAGYELLRAEEQSAISVEDWLVFYGSVLGYFCPDNLGRSDLDPTADAALIALEQFRAIVPRLDGISDETDAFARAMDQTTLERLRLSACGPADNAEEPTEQGPDPTVAEQPPDNESFGLAIMTSYQNDLTDGDRQQLSLSGYGELYGAVVGWFCPANLPR